MPDLTIKPNAGSGNKIIIQDQAGAAVLTTADSGATLANATLNSPTLVTPALGTPASGVMTNMTGTLTNATFPAGHVVRVYSRTYTSTHALGTSASWTTVGLTDANNLDITMDVPASSSSKYFIQVNLSVSDHVSGNIDFRLLDIVDNYIPVRATGASNRADYFLGLGHQSTGNGSYHHIRSVGGSYLWSPNVSTAQRVKLQGSCISGSTVFYINRSTTDTDANWSSRSTSTMTVMEIAG